MRLTIFFTLLFGAVCGFAQTYQGSLIAPSTVGGYVLSWDSPLYYTGVLISKPDGKLAFSDQVEKGDKKCQVWAVDSDGLAARACQVRNEVGEKGSIEVFDAKAPLSAAHTIDTGAYLTQHMAFAPDHSLWTVGYSYSDVWVRDFQVVHHYSRTGEQLGQSLPWRQIASNNNGATALQLCLGAKQMFAGNDRVGFRAFTHPGAGSWIEVSPAGEFLGQVDLGVPHELEFTPVAMTADGTLYARIWKASQRDGWAVLDRTNGAWRRITNAPAGTLIGTDGDNVVFARAEGDSTVLTSVRPDALDLDLRESTLAAVSR